MCRITFLHHGATYLWFSRIGRRLIEFQHMGPLSNTQASWVFRFDGFDVLAGLVDEGHACYVGLS